MGVKSAAVARASERRRVRRVYGVELGRKAYDRKTSEELAVTCWCEDEVVFVDKRLVALGETLSCDGGIRCRDRRRGGGPVPTPDPKPQAVYPGGWV